MNRIETEPAIWKKKKRIAWICAFSFLLVLAGIFTFIKIGPQKDGTSSIFRYGFMANEKLWHALQSKKISLERTVPSGKKPRVNGTIGLRTELPEGDYKIQVVQDELKESFGLGTILVLPKTSHSTEFRCIEGWSEDMQYAGIRFSDFMSEKNLGKKKDGTYYSYVGLETPDGKYYVSIDMESMLHPQTLLAWEMNGKPLSRYNGHPLRLMIPIKYGIKSLKRVGKIIFSDERPRDYWAERGYDWYSGL